MSELKNLIVRGFSTTYRLNAKSGEQEPVEWVEYSPAHDPTGTATKVRVKELIPPEAMRNDDDGTKLNMMHLKWRMIEPAYAAWKKGIEIPVDGTPLAVWAGITPEQADVLRSHGIKTIEALRDTSETLLNKIRLPNMKMLREMAGKFLESKSAAAAAAQVVERDETIKNMQAMMEEMAARLAAVDGKDAPAKRGPGRPRKEVDESEAA